MYNGRLVTIKLKNNEVLVAIRLNDLNIIEDEAGFKLIDKRYNKTLGYLEKAYGIDIEEFISFFNNK